MGSLILETLLILGRCCICTKLPSDFLRRENPSHKSQSENILKGQIVQDALGLVRLQFSKELFKDCTKQLVRSD